MKQENDSGFTLLEVFGAMLVFALGILAFTRLQVGSLKTNTFGSDLTQAVTIAQDKAEVLLGLPYTHVDLNDTDGNGTGEDANGDGADDDGGNFGLGDNPDEATHAENDGNADHTETVGRFRAHWNIADNYPIENSKTVRIVVSWRDSNNAYHRSQLECTKADLF
jgi:type IV pilus assembly protein PilV